MHTLLGSITIVSLSFTGLLPTMPVSDTSPPELGASLRDDTLQSMLSTLPSATLAREDTTVSYYHRNSDVALTSQSSLGDLILEQVSDNEALTVTSSDYLQLISVVNDANDLPRYRLSTTDEDIEIVNMIAKPERSYINNKCYSGRVVSVSTLKPITKLKPVSASKCR